ncbi:MAG: proline/glycine betaine ABC transporter substrate-binding protein ProX, partial [bacterium]|nr:proline/glycine betaine ABC transporter substrate-binding protein ProX [bacterium]
MRRISIVVLGILLVLVVSPLAAGMAQVESEDDGAGKQPVRMARATWDTGWFQAEVYRLLIQRLGYRVEGPVTMDNDEFYQALAVGEVDLWANGWFPTHDVFLQEGSVEPV